MNKIELTSDEIVDLIFEKKIIIDNVEISLKHSCLSVLSTLEDRIYAKNIFRRNAFTSILSSDLKKAI